MHYSHPSTDKAKEKDSFVGGLIIFHGWTMPVHPIITFLKVPYHCETFQHITKNWHENIYVGVETPWYFLNREIKIFQNYHYSVFMVIMITKENFKISWICIFLITISVRLHKNIKSNILRYTDKRKRTFTEYLFTDIILRV